MFASDPACTLFCVSTQPPLFLYTVALLSNRSIYIHIIPLNLSFVPHLALDSIYILTCHLEDVLGKMLCSKELGRDRACFIGPPFIFFFTYDYVGSVTADPLVHHGRHFGRAVFAFANVKSLIMNGLDRMADEDAPNPETLSAKYNLLSSVYFQCTN